MNENHWVHTAEGKGPQWIRDHATYTGEECVCWPLTRDGHVGRGRLTYRGTGFWAHRVMLEYVKGPPPTPKHQAAHGCGNGHLACMHPGHLSWKTASENALDRATHGTNRPRLRRRKLTVQQVEEIKALKGIKTQVELAVIYGVSDNAIRNIHAGRTWGPNAKRERIFSDVEVAEIKVLDGYLSKQEIANMFGGSVHAIGRLLSGKTYRDAA